MKRTVVSLVALFLSVAVLSTAHAQVQTWTDGSGNMLWDTTSANWTPGPTWNNSVPDSGIFGGTGAGTVSVVGTNDFNWITFDSQYTITNGTLALEGYPSIITNSDQVEIDSALVDGTSGPSQLVLDTYGTTTITGVATNTYSDGTIVNDGTLNLPAAQNPNGDVIGTLVINNSATVNADVAFALGANNTAAADKCTNITINAGTLSLDGEYDSAYGLKAANSGGISPNVITMNAGAITYSGTGARSEFDWAGIAGYSTEPQLNILSNSVPSQIDCIMDLTLNGAANYLDVNVAAGGLLQITNQISDNGGAALVFSGPGVTDLSGPDNLGSAFGNGGGGATTTTITNGTLLIDGSMDQASTMVLDGGLLAGSGVIYGPVMNNSGGTLGAGDLSTNIGTLTVSNAVTLNSGSTTLIRFSKNGGVITNDVLNVNSIAYGGTLVLTNITSDGNTLAVGDTFTLFIAPLAGDYSGGFSSFVLPTLPAGWTWDTSKLSVNGSIEVINSTATPTFSPAAGTYSGSQTVTVSCSTPSATIYYTTDGTPPTTSSPQGASPINITVPANTTMTIKAFAQAPGFTASATGSATYNTVTPVPSATAVWTSLATPGSWASYGNWSNYFIANNYSGTNVTADFSELTLSQNMTVTLDGNWTIANLISGDQGNTYNWTISPGTGTQLTLNNYSNSPSVITVDNGTNNITAVLAGLNGLVKNGNGYLELTAPEASPDTYSNGTVVNAGGLYVGPGGKNGIIFGPVTVNSNATVYLDRSWACGYDTPAGGYTTNGGSHRGVTSLTINPGGTVTWVNPSGAGSGGFAGNVITMTGGTINGRSSSANSWDWTGDAYASYTNHAQFNVIGSPWTATVAGPYSLNERMGNSGTNSSGMICFNVGKGTTSSNIDLEWTVPIGNNNGGNICMCGPGTMQIASSASTILSTTTYHNWVIVSNGVLLVECNVGVDTMGAVYGGVLGGNGTFNNNVTNYAGGTIKPGDLSTNVGQLAVFGSLVLDPGSTTICRINLSSSSAYTYDNVIGPTTLTYGGTLIVEDVSGVTNNADLVVGDSFNLFQAVGAYVGNFAALQLPPLGFGEAWSWSPSTGTLSVVATAMPVLTAFGPFSHGTFLLTFGGENGHNYEVLTSTNVSLPLASWTVLTSGTFGTGAVNYTDTSATNGAQFYIIESQ